MDPFTQFMESPPFFQSWYTWAFVIAFAVLAGIRSYLRGPQYFSQKSLKGKVALVTGGNRGIGYFVARELAIRGAKVYIGCRDEDLGKAAEERLRTDSKNADVHFMCLKLGSLEDVRNFTKAIKQKEKKIDILCINAGVMTCPPSRTVDGFEYHFGVNYLGHYVLVKELLGCVKEAAPGARIVIMTSAAYSLGHIHYEDVNRSQFEYENGSECFSQSKLALMLLMNKLSRMLKDTGITVNACHPGVVRTDIHRYMPIKTSPFLYYSTFLLTWYLMKNPNDGAQTPIFLCVDDSVEQITGQYFIDMQSSQIEGVASDADEADKFWDFTEQLIKSADDNRTEKQEAQSKKDLSSETSNKKED